MSPPQWSRTRIDFVHVDNKDASLFPLAIPNHAGKMQLAILHRPLFAGTRPEETAVHAQFADLFASPARNIYIWFSDLFGLTETYNAPGTVHEDHWSLRLGPDFLDQYIARMKRGEALDLPGALALSLRSKGEEFRAQHAPLLSRLGRLSSVEAAS